jgi:hypothetical protein
VKALGGTNLAGRAAIVRNSWQRAGSNIRRPRMLTDCICGGMEEYERDVSEGIVTVQISSVTLEKLISCELEELEKAVENLRFARDHVTDYIVVEQCKYYARTHLMCAISLDDRLAHTLGPRA